MTSYRLYHATLGEPALKIDTEGIKLNTEKANREIKGLTDLFNHVFNETSRKYLPEKINHQGIDRNSARFLSLHPDEFRKSKHPAPYTPLHQAKPKLVDVVYECDVEVDLPAFDVQLFDDWADDLLKYLNSCQTLHAYKNIVTRDKSDAQEEIKHLSNIFTFFITGDISILGLFNNLGSIENQVQREVLQEFSAALLRIQQEVIMMTEIWVKKYCEKAVRVSELQQHYEAQAREGKVSWVLQEDNDELPAEITQLEILCNVDITRDKIKKVFKN